VSRVAAKNMLRPGSPLMVRRRLQRSSGRQSWARLGRGTRCESPAADSSYSLAPACATGFFAVRQLLVRQRKGVIL